MGPVLQNKRRIALRIEAKTTPTGQFDTQTGAGRDMDRSLACMHLALPVSRLDVDQTRGTAEPTMASSGGVVAPIKSGS